jgi:hypothetical protein
MSQRLGSRSGQAARIAGVVSPSATRPTTTRRGPRPTVAIRYRGVRRDDGFTTEAQRARRMTERPGAPPTAVPIVLPVNALMSFRLHVLCASAVRMTACCRGRATVARAGPSGTGWRPAAAVPAPTAEGNGRRKFLRSCPKFGLGRNVLEKRTVFRPAGRSVEDFPGGFRFSREFPRPATGHEGDIYRTSRRHKCLLGGHRKPLLQRGFSGSGSKGRCSGWFQGESASSRVRLQDICVSLCPVGRHREGG